jgi:hypothetical protein
MNRRVIRVGSRTLNGFVCNRCPSRPVLYPKKALEEHRRGVHAAPDAEPAPEVKRSSNILGDQLAKKHRYHGGRPFGSKNARGTMSSTGVEKRVSIKQHGGAR